MLYLAYADVVFCSGSMHIASPSDDELKFDWYKYDVPQAD